MAGLALAVALPPACGSAADLGAQASSGTPSEAALPSTAAPAVKAGMAVVDRTGVQVGAIESVAESPQGPIVVAKIDGKLVGLRPATLRLDGERAVSSQSKAEMVAAAGAPR
jgi:hypothetical protein